MLLAYVIMKGAIENFTGGLAQMLAERGIRVNGRLGFDPWNCYLFDDARGGREELRQASAPRTGRSAGGARHGLYGYLLAHSLLSYTSRHHHRGNRRQALHLRKWPVE